MPHLNYYDEYYEIGLVNKKVTRKFLPKKSYRLIPIPKL